MANDDPRDDRQKFRKERERVRHAAIPDLEREAILSFGDAKDEAGAKSTATRQMKTARRVNEMATEVGYPSMIDWDHGDFESFYGRLKNAEVPDGFLKHVGPDGWSKGSLRQKKNALKQFLLFLGERDDDSRTWTDEDNREWVDDLELGAPPKPKVDPNDLLGPDELAAMWDAIDNLRDRAMFAVAYCTWQRNAVLRSFMVDDVEMYNGGTEGEIRIYEDALGRKGAEGRKPLSWAVGPVSEWLQKHPRSGDPEATLLCVTHDAGDAKMGAPLSTAESVNRRLRTIAKRAGLDKDRWDTRTGRKQRTLRAHLLRYTGATRAAKSDAYSESTVKKWGGWHQSSDQLDRYIQMTDDDVLASWANAHEIDSGAFDSIHPEFSSCGRCSGPVEDWHETCPACGHELSEDPPTTDVEAVDEEVLEELVEERVDDRIQAAATEVFSDQIGAYFDAVVNQAIHADTVDEKAEIMTQKPSFENLSPDDLDEDGFEIDDLLS